jgi:thioredoxin 1
MAEKDLIELDDKNWEEMVEKGAAVAVMFHSPLCPHCRAMMPIFSELAGKFKGRIAFGRIDVRNNPYAVNRYGITAVPTLTFFCAGRPVQQILGEVEAAVLRRITDDALKSGNQCASRSTPLTFNAGYV